MAKKMTRFLFDSIDFQYSRISSYLKRLLLIIKAPTDWHGSFKNDTIEQMSQTGMVSTTRQIQFFWLLYPEC